MEGEINVKNIAYVKLKIEKVVIPPSYNLVKHVMLQEGMGYAVPILQLNLMDATGTLQNQLSLLPGVVCDITITRDIDKSTPYSGSFSLWGMERYVDSEGPALKVLFIMNVPKWAAGVYCENFRANSSDVMAQIAGRGGLSYSGPKGSTDDKMNWLNINQTRSSFSEDVAAHGWMNASSCMCRAVTLNKELRYKNIFDSLAESEKATLCLNYPEQGTNPITMRETVDVSGSSAFSHWVNYGQVQHEHSLDTRGQQPRDKMTVPKMGDQLPINSKIKGEISELGARVNYVMWDVGTEPNPQSNLHTHYEEAGYQNLRGLGLWGEKIRTLTPFPTDLHTFDCVKYLQKDPSGNQFVDSRARNGKYLVSGRTILIKNGHNYSEVLDLFRPYVNNAGGHTDATPKQSSANAGYQIAKSLGHIGNSLSSSPYPASNLTGSSLFGGLSSIFSSTRSLLSSLLDFNVQIPSIPSIPLLTSGASSITSAVNNAQQNVLNALTQIASVPNSINNAINNSIAGVETAALATVKRVSSSVITTSANATIDAIIDAAQSGASSIEGITDSVLRTASAAVNLEKPLLDRFSESYDNIVNKRISSVVSQTNSISAAIGDLVGDLNQGGVFAQDLVENGVANVTDIAKELGRPVINAATQLSNMGTNFVLPAASFGIGAGDVALNPHKTAAYLADSIATITTPANLVKDFGAKNYEQMFGNLKPDDAFVQLKQVEDLAKQVAQVFDPNEVLAGSGIANVLGRVSGEVGDIVSGTVDGVQDLYGNVVSTPLKAVNALEAGKSALIDKPLNDVDNFVNTLSNDVSGGVADLARIPSNSVTGLVNDVTGVADQAASAVNRTTGTAIGAVKAVGGAALSGISGPVTGLINGVIEPTGRFLGSVEGQVRSATGAVEPLSNAVVDMQITAPKADSIARRINGQISGSLNADGTISGAVNALLEDKKLPVADTGRTLLTKPIAKIVNTSSGVRRANDTNEAPRQEISAQDAASSAKSQLLFNDPNLTVKINKKQTPLTGLSLVPSSGVPEKKTAENLLAQEFAFQFGDPNMQPLVERVVNKTTQFSSSKLQGIAVYETVRDPVSWSTYTRIGSNEAKRTSSDNHWEFPHSDPFMQLKEDDGSSHSV